ncbi:MAG: peptide chain release factor N(5)-glutamine methyltransferase [Clostridiales Family XIII bacterium]|jgi:release factor glutamine methyltransferase|nr:peptide chain release factor N(5)-glutamine methyltransferase [Clostridiales Family XIII bacterium]
MGLQIKEIISVAENILRESGDADYKVDAEMLLSHAIKYDPQKIFMNWAKEVDDDHAEIFFAMVQKRAEGTPTQYLTNEQDFKGRRFYVDENVLIPRPETELLTDEVSAYLKDNKSAKTALDLGTGSGVIAISLAKKFPSLKLTASDISEGALAVAERNASRIGVKGQIRFTRSDVFDGFKTGFTGSKWDLIVSNPPYIRTSVLPTLQREIYEHEPITALDGGEDGLDFYRRIIDGAPTFLRKTGAVFFEIGYDQAHDVTTLFRENGNYVRVAVTPDIAGHDRVISARMK